MCLPAQAALAQAQATRVYEGKLGGTAIELQTLDDREHDGISGYLLEPSTGRQFALEATPHEAGKAAMVDVIGPAGLPIAAISFRPFSNEDASLAGQWIDLRTHETLTLSAKIAGEFSTDVSKGYDASLFLAGSGGSLLFRVHAHRARGEYGGLVDRIDILDRASGRQVQTIDHLILDFFGVDTLKFFDYNGDRQIDFSANRMAISDDGSRSTGSRTYFLYDSRQHAFEHFQPLDDLEQQGAVTFPALGEVDMRPEDKLDYTTRSETWQRYRFVTPDRLVLRDSIVKPFGG